MRNTMLALPMVISPTRVELAHRCHRRHLLADFLHLRRSPLESRAAVFGRQFHKGTADWWRSLEQEGLQATSAFQRARDVALADWPLGEGDYHTPELMTTMLEEYTRTARLAGDAPGDWEIVDIEKRLIAEVEDFTSYVPVPVEIRFMLDRILRNAKGELCVVDTKTSSNPNYEWERSMLRSVQQKLYKGLAERVYSGTVNYHFAEGVAKKGKHAGSVVYAWLDLAWRPGHITEALQLVEQAALRDYLALQNAYGCTSEEMKALQLTLSQQTDEEAEPLEVQLTAELLDYVLKRSAHNRQDCRSYFSDCPYLELCDADPEERIGLALGDYIQAEPWTSDLEDA